MIRINLLEVREERRRVAMRNLAIASGLMLLVTIGFVYTWHASLVGDVDYARDRIRKEQAQIEQLDKIVSEVEDAKGKKAGLESKLKLIRSLEGNRAEIVDLLLALSEVLSEEIWLNDLKINERNITAKAQAVDMQTIGLMVRRLKEDDRFTSPRTGGISADSKGVVKFELSMQFNAPQAVEMDAEPAGNQPGGQR